jgi:Flp pilus assembly protein TadG
MVRTERGAVAVEFAVVLPVLLIFLLGIIEFGLAFNAQISLTQAAREGARAMAISDNSVAARKSARAAVSPMISSRINDADIEIVSSDLSDPAVAPIEDACEPGNHVAVTIEYSYQPITGFLGPINLVGKSAMRCGG